MMYHAPALLLLAALSSASLLPTWKSKQTPSPSAFTLEVARHSEDNRDFFRHIAAAKQKWGTRKTASSSSVGNALALSGDDDALVNASPERNDVAYVSDVQIGNPPQTVKMIMDTGSADVWVQSTDTDYRINTNGPWAPQYHPSDSHTSRVLDNSTWSLRYEDGTSAYGIVYQDTIQFGAVKLDNATIESAQAIASRVELDLSVSGVMGLGKRLRSLVRPPVPTLIDQLRPRLASPVFTVDFRRNATGQIDFGRVDTARASDPLVWLDSVPASPHWDVVLDLTSWTAHSGTRQTRRTWYRRPFNTTIDTGTSIMFLPDELASRYWLAVPGMVVIEDHYAYPCANTDILPDLLFKLPGPAEKVLTVPGRYISFGPVNATSDYCWGGMQSAKDYDSPVMGDVFLKAVFVAFDMEKERIGFANKVLVDV